MPDIVARVSRKEDDCLMYAIFPSMGKPDFVNWARINRLQVNAGNGPRMEISPGAEPLVLTDLR
jgi:hypothetical protein